MFLEGVIVLSVKVDGFFGTRLGFRLSVEFLSLMETTSFSPVYDIISALFGLWDF